jgi:hypothetical protein
LFPTLRITFGYEDGRIRIVSQQPVDIRPAPSDPIYDFHGQSGTWFEVHDDEGHLLYRRVIHDPMPVDLEAPSGDPQRPFTRVPRPEQRGTFVLTLPNLSRGRSLVLHASPGDDRRKPAREIARFDLRRGAAKESGPGGPEPRGGQRPEAP